MPRRRLKRKSVEWIVVLFLQNIPNYNIQTNVLSRHLLIYFNALLNVNDIMCFIATLVSGSQQDFMVVLPTRENASTIGIISGSSCEWADLMAAPSAQSSWLRGYHVRGGIILNDKSFYIYFDTFGKCRLTMNQRSAGECCMKKYLHITILHNDVCSRSTRT